MVTPCCPHLDIIHPAAGCCYALCDALPQDLHIGLCPAFARLPRPLAAPRPPTSMQRHVQCLTDGGSWGFACSSRVEQCFSALVMNVEDRMQRISGTTGGPLHNETKGTSLEQDRVQGQGTAVAGSHLERLRDAERALAVSAVQQCIPAARHEAECQSEITRLIMQCAAT